MKKKSLAVIYWPQGGHTENMAMLIAAEFSNAGLYDVDFLLENMNVLDDVTHIIAGCSTSGNENWEDSREFSWLPFFQQAKEGAFKGKTIALFGLGDQILYPMYFVNDMAILYEEFTKLGANMVGKWKTDAYSFTESKAMEDGYFVGLALDEDNQYELSNERIAKWTSQLKKEHQF